MSDDDDRDDGRQQQDDEQQLSEDTMTNTLALWESVEKTDPAHTKGFQKGGGFSGTAINAVYLARRATETFGPIGTGWGVEVVDEAYIDGAPIMDKDGNVLCREVIHKVRVKLWYMRDGKRGEVEHYGLTTFVGKNKYGPFTDEDHAKKSLTDATTKALSLLGFAADVHLGRFDDNKYVNDLRREFSARNDDGNAAAGRQEAARKPVATPDDGETITILDSLREAALDGMDALSARFKAIPAGAAKQAVWAQHGAALKAAANKTMEQPA